MSAAGPTAATAGSADEPAAAASAPSGAEEAHHEDGADLEADLHHPEPQRARRASVTLALMSFAQVGHDTTMHGHHTDEAHPGGQHQSPHASGTNVPDAAAAMIAARKSAKKQQEEAWLGAVHRCTLLSSLHAAELA